MSLYLEARPWLKANLTKRATCPHCGREGMAGGMALHIRRCGDFGGIFWPRVAKTDDGSCWLWQGRKDAAGYGRYDRKGPYTYAHRIAWMLTKGEIPADMEVAHSCDVRACCNPAHLFLATHDENMQDCKQKRRHSFGEHSHHAKLTEAQVIEIRQRFRFYGPRKTNARELAPEYGVRPNAIYLAATGRTWKYLPMPIRDGDYSHE